MELFNNFKKDQFGQVMAKAADKGLPALMLQFYWREGQPSLDTISQQRDAAPAEVQVDAIAGRAIVPCALDIDTAWSQLARRLGAFNISITAPDGKPLGYQAIVYDGPERTTFKDKHEFLARIDPSLLARLDSILPKGKARRRASIIVYALERLVDDLQRQLVNIGYGASRIHIDSISQVPLADRVKLLVRCERDLHNRLLRVAGASNSALVERAILHVLHEAATASGPIVIRKERLGPARPKHLEDAANQVAHAIAMAKTAREFAEQAAKA